MLAVDSERIRRFAYARVAPILDRLRERTQHPRVQQMGRQAEQVWSKATNRWPILATFWPKPKDVVATVRETPRYVVPKRMSTKPPAQHEDVAPVIIDDASENLPTILRLVADLETSESWEVRASAAAGLGDFHGDLVLDALISAVRDPSAEVALEAVGALARQTDGRAWADLTEVLRESAGYLSPLTRAAAVAAIARLRGAAALPLMLETVHDYDAEVSIAAIRAAAALSPLDALVSLRTLLEDRSCYYAPPVRFAAAEALEANGVLSPDLALELIRTEPDEYVRGVLARVAQS